MRSIEIPQPEERNWRYRAFEILPGALTWTILLLPVILGLINLRLTAYFVVAFLLVWFVRNLAVAFRSLQGFRQMDKHQKLDWAALNKDLENLSTRAPNAPKWHYRNIIRVKDHLEHNRVKPSEVYHAVIVASYKESRETIEPTLQAILHSHHDPQKIILIMAYEERGGPEIEILNQNLVKKYGPQFFYAETIKHPKDIPGEVIGKGGNITFAGHRLKKILEELKIEPRQVIVTTLDADNHPDKKYFGALTYTFCSTENPKHVSYQPIAMYLNNIWDAPAPMRVIATGNSFWSLVLSQRLHVLRNFSSHAQPMEALIDTDFWSVRTIVEDGHQFWRTYFRYDGNYQVFPIYLPIYQDAVFTGSYRQTLKAQFVQLQRWAWGASDVAYIADKGFFTPNHVPRRDLILKFLRHLEGHVSWSTMPIVLLSIALVPFFLNPDSYIANQLPQIASRLNTVAMSGILVTLFLSMRSLPPRPERYKRHRTLWMVVQWIYLPFTTILYNSTAAINAQTRLMLGKYISKFAYTEKAVKK